MIQRQPTVTFIFRAELRSGIGSMSVPFFMVWRESGFALQACGKALPDHSSQGLRLRLTQDNSTDIPAVLSHLRFLLRRPTVEISLLH
jgi:hypothetical protein